MKRIVVMGATSGIGLAVAQKLARLGHKVGVAGRRVDILKELKKDYPDNMEYEEIDVTKDDAPRKLESLIKKLGGMDTYFHVAGVFYNNPDLELKDEMITLETNAVGFARMTSTAYRYFRDNNRKGHIAAITSVAGTRGMGPIASYSSTKKFGQTYLEALQQLAHLQKVDIKFTDIRPGWIRTPLMKADREYPVTMKLSYAGPLIIKGLSSCKTAVYVDWRWEALVRLCQLMPRCLWVRFPFFVDWAASGRQRRINKVVEKAEQIPAPQLKAQLARQAEEKAEHKAEKHSENSKPVHNNQHKPPHTNSDNRHSKK